MAHRDIAQFQKSLKRARRSDRAVSTSKYQARAGSIELDSRATRKLKQELTMRDGKARVDGGLSEGVKRRMKRSARRSFAKMKDLSPAERRKLVSKYMKDVESLWGEDGAFTDADGGSSVASGSKKPSSARPKTGLFSALSGSSEQQKASARQKAHKKTVSRGASAARSMITGTDRDGNRVSYGSDRGPRTPLAS